MTEKLQRLELTWPGKEDRFNPEPRILLEDKEKSYSKPVKQAESVGYKEKFYNIVSSSLKEDSSLSSPLEESSASISSHLGENSASISSPLGENSASISSPLRGEDKGEGDKHSSTSDLLSFARNMRKNPTEAEKKLWFALKNQQLGDKFRRQHQIGQYIVDFVCLEKKLIIECDGGQHNEQVDRERTSYLEAQGYKVIRFWNNEILSNLEGVLFVIKENLSSPSPQPSPTRGEGNCLLEKNSLSRISSPIKVDSAFSSPLRENSASISSPLRGEDKGEGDNKADLPDTETPHPNPLPQGARDSASPLKGGEVQPTYDNMLIHGDNLLALKALEQDYTGKVKCIYIDPPYNTGNAFEHYDDGLEHSIWLSLMRDRLEILKRLLAEDGSIWISLDDNEQAYCKVLCDEIFGRGNFVCNVIWQKKYSPANDAKWLSDNHDFILVYAKNKQIWRPNLLPRSEEMNARYKNLDNDPRGPWKPGDLSVKTYTASCD